MADRENKGASGKGDEELYKGFKTPLSLLFADPRTDLSTERDELGNSIYRTPEGKAYIVGDVKRPDSAADIAKKVYAATPPMEDWRLPTKDETVKGLKAGGKAVAEGLWDVVKTPTNPDATLGDLFDVGATMAAPGASKALSKIDPTTTRMFFGPESPKADIKKLEDAISAKKKGLSEEEMWRETGWWEGPNGWRFEVSDDKFTLDPRIWKNLEGQPIDGVGTEGKLSGLTSHKDFWDALPQDTRYARIIGPGNLKTTRSGEGGAFDPRSGDIEASAMSEQDLKKVILHELQHLEQATADKKGRGFNPKYIAKDVDDTISQLPRVALEYLADKRIFDKKDKLLKQAQDIKKNGSPKGWESTENNLFKSLSDDDLLKAIAVNNIKKKSFEKRSKVELGDDFVEDLDAFHKGMSDFDPGLIQSKFGWTKGDTYTTSKNRSDSAFNKYEREVGEAEARAVMHRKDLTPEQRATRHPKKDFDVPLDELYTQQDFVNMMNRLAIGADNFNQNGPAPRFAEGGVVEDPNQVPPGALPNEVADTVDIKASEGEYIIPANVVRFLGLDKLEKMVTQAKGKLDEMQQNGRMGDTGEEELPFSAEELMSQEQETPAFAAGGLVQQDVHPNMDLTSTEMDPNTGLPLWLTDRQNTPVPSIPVQNFQAPQQEQRDSKAGEYGTELTGMAQGVDKWSPKDFNTYATNRNSVEQKIGQNLASAIPFGGLAVRAREKYLERNVPRELSKMIESKVDLQGNPLDATQLSQLQDTYNRVTTEALNKGFGYSSVAKKIAQDTGLINKPSAEKDAAKAAKQQAQNQKDGLINRAMDALTKDRSAEARDKAAKSTSEKSKSGESEKSRSSDNTASSKTSTNKTSSKDNKSKSR